MLLSSSDELLTACLPTSPYLRAARCGRRSAAREEVAGHLSGRSGAGAVVAERTRPAERGRARAHRSPVPSRLGLRGGWSR